MLVEYEYELLSYFAGKSTIKSDNIVFVSFNIINALDDNINKYLERLKEYDVVKINKNGVDIYIDKWVEVFLNFINKKFLINNIDIVAKYINEKNIINFIVDDTEVNFNIVIKKENKCYSEDCIFMSSLNLSLGDLHWIDLLNDNNKLQMFYMYLKKEVSRLNINKYKEINIFEGIAETHISEIFNVSLKKYFENIKKNEIPVDLETKLLIKNIVKKDNFNYYGIDFGEFMLVVIKDNCLIKFISIKDEEVIFSKEIDKTIKEIQNKLVNKVSEFRKLHMYKENKIIENSSKLTDSAIKLFLPLITAINILGLSKFITVESISRYRYIPYIIAGILVGLQIFIIILVYAPAYKLARFKWDI